LQLHDRTFGVFYLSHDAKAVLIVDATCVREAELSCRALKQANAEALFEL